MVLTKAVREAMAAAKETATSLSGSIASAIGAGIDSVLGRNRAALGNSPEARRLREIEAAQRGAQVAAEKSDLQWALFNAATPAERLAAQKALDAWMLEQERQALEASLAQKDEVLQREAEARKTFAERGLADLTDSLNRGLINQKQYNDGLKRILAASGVDYASLGEMLGSAFANSFRDQILQLRKAIRGVTGGRLTLLGGPDLPSFASGISYVPQDMTANIHAGEAVLDRRDAAAWRSGVSGAMAVRVELSGGLEYLRDLIEVKVDQMAEGARRRGLAAGAVR